MEAVLTLIASFVGPELAKWVAGGIATVGSLIALFVAKRRGISHGRKEVIQEAEQRHYEDISTAREAEKSYHEMSDAEKEQERERWTVD